MHVPWHKTRLQTSGSGTQQVLNKLQLEWTADVSSLLPVLQRTAWRLEEAMLLFQMGPAQGHLLLAPHHSHHGKAHVRCRGAHAGPLRAPPGVLPMASSSWLVSMR